MGKEQYKHTGKLARFTFRRSRLHLLIWFAALVIITTSTAVSFTDLYKTEQERQVIAETMKNPAMIAMIGPGYGLDNYTQGAMIAHQMLLFTAIAVVIMNILLVARHTRSDEEEGRLELLRSFPIGRLASLTATFLVLFTVNVLLAFVIGVGLASLQIESMNLHGSLLYGAALGGIGIFFAALTALFAQLTENARGTIGFSLAALGVAYLLRAVGDVSNGIFSWLSPLSWMLRTEVYVSNYWWPIVLLLFTSLVLAGVALYLNSLRDLGASFLPSKPGRTEAASYLRTPFALAFRLQRTSIIAWAIGVYILGASYGSVLGDIESFFVNNEIVQQFLVAAEGSTLTEQFLPMLMSIMSMFCTIPVLLMLLKLRSEEKKNFAEHLLASAVSRAKLMGSYWVLAILISIIMQMLSIAGLWSAAIAVMDEAIFFTTILKAALAYLPALWLMTGLAMLLLGFFPQLISVVWLYLVYSFVVVYLGGLLQLPDYMEKLSPFGHIPQLPVEEVNFFKLFLLSALAIIFTVVGFIGYNRRDIVG